jgi:hypothetical protein
MPQKVAQYVAYKFDVHVPPSLGRLWLSEFCAWSVASFIGLSA